MATPPAAFHGITLIISDIELASGVGATVRVLFKLVNAGSAAVSPGLLQIEGRQGDKTVFRASAANAWPLDPGETVTLDTVVPYHSTAQHPLRYHMIAYHELPCVTHELGDIFEYRFTTRRLSGPEN